MVTGHPEQAIAEDRVVDLADKHAERDQRDSRQPGHLEECPRQVTQVLGRHPIGELIRKTIVDCRITVDKELGEQRHPEYALADYRASHVEQDEELRPRKSRVRTFRDLDKEDYRHPLRCGTNTHAGDQLHVERTGYHNER